MNESTAGSFDVAVIGAGVAGLAAASALSVAGARVAIFERRPLLGGRAYSYTLPAVGEEIDSQHVIVGCCTNFRHLAETSGVANHLRWYDGYTFLQPGGRVSRMQPGLLPAPAHSGLSFLRAPMLSFIDKAAIARALLSFLRGYSRDDRESVAHWLHRMKQPPGAIRHFWQPILISALNDSLDRCSMRYAGQVMHESFLKSPEASRLGIPTLPLSRFFGKIAQAQVQHGVSLMDRFGVQRIDRLPEGWELTLHNSTRLRAQRIVLAVSFEHLSPLLGPDLLSQVLPSGTEPFLHSPITTVHLWFDREVTELHHATLLDTSIEWLFHKSRIRGWPAERGSYLELTSSASHRQLGESRDQILTRALQELESFFPSVGSAQLRKSAVLKEARATFSVTPGLDRHRPSQRTAVSGLYFAGDWTATGWPSTMEGAVRSGYLAADAILRDEGSPRQCLQPDLAATGLMALLASRLQANS